MSDLKQPPSPRVALNIVLNGHGATCGSYALSCKKCEREHEAVLVLRALIEASETVLAEPEQAGKAQLFELADEWLKRAAAIRSHEGVTAAAEALEDCANELLALLPAPSTKEGT